MTCDAACKTIVAAVCGNGRARGRRAVRRQQPHRSRRLQQDLHVRAGRPHQLPEDAVRHRRQLRRQQARGAILGIAQGQLQTPLDTGVTDGSISILFNMIGLDDLSGANDPPSRSAW